MAHEFKVRIASDVGPLIEDWRDRFVSTVGIAKYRRAAGWAMDETAKAAVVGIRKQFHKTLKWNTPWTQRAIKYTGPGVGSLNQTVLLTINDDSAWTYSTKLNGKPLT
ncbi:hypothetical protein [Methylobacterium sp. Leaf117]|uniref:hypothetical protein n=1 Tax=Methylobacterium sp. Leaf117 TaxID=1736260 RepID=UPI0006F79C0D|nr:hypothetical protein [Methylobacterium sp. Leaf117]KQP79244.1 hypothetical protein ASF57_18765 [Methylobacterium sp. Leaf117]